MPKIELHTYINAKQSIVFDLSRSIDLHKISTQNTNEKAIAGTTSGLLGLNDFVTWRAKHFGVYQRLTSKITEFNYPDNFTDEMIKGAFKSFYHQHIFTEINGTTKMTDIFIYQSPLGLFGRFADTLFLKKYMTNFLLKRNQVIKEFAETNKWREVLIS